jgi:acyl transferase domain-containing protein
VVITKALLGWSPLLSGSVRGGMREAERVAAELMLRRGREAGKVTVSELLDLWTEQHTPSWPPSTVENHKSRVAQVKADPIGRVRLAKLSAVGVDRWHARSGRA